MTRYKQRTAPLMALLVLLGLCLVWLPMRGAALAAGTNAEYNASSDKVTGYFMEIPITGEEGYFMFREDRDTLYNLPGVEKFPYWNRSQRQVTLLITFPDVTHAPEGFQPEPVFVSGTALLEFPARGLAGYRIDILSSLRLNIRDGFYNLFVKAMGGDWKTDKNYSGSLRFEVSMFAGGYAFGLSETTTRNPSTGVVKPQLKTFTKTITMSVKDLPPDVSDPDSPNFDPGTNGGSVTNDPGQKVPWLRSFYDFLSDLFNWSLSYDWFKVIFWIVAVLVVFSIIVAICRAIVG